MLTHVHGVFTQTQKIHEYSQNGEATIGKQDIFGQRRKKGKWGIQFQK